MAAALDDIVEGEVALIEHKIPGYPSKRRVGLLQIDEVSVDILNHLYSCDR